MARINQLTGRFGRWLRPVFPALALAALPAVDFAVRATADEANPDAQMPSLRTDLPYGVSRVTNSAGIYPVEAGRNDFILLEVKNFDDWRKSQPQAGQNGKLVLYLGGEALNSLSPRFFPPEWEEREPDKYNPNVFRTNRISYYGVRLEQNDTDRAVWKKLGRNLGFSLKRPMEVSLGYAGGPPMNTWVYPQPVVEQSPFFLVMLSKGQVILGVVVIAGAFLLFIQLTRRTDILRDPSVALRPDGSKPFSLARAQMAFWFFMVVGSFFFLWLLSGDTDTLNASTLTLIGISAGTAVSSAFIDMGKRGTDDFYENVVSKTGLQKRREDLLADLKSDLCKTEDAIQELRNRIAAPEKKDPQTAADDDRRLAALIDQKERLEGQIEFFAAPRWKAAMQDLLNENGVTSFHRFQMCVWTIVLGIIFVAEVYTKMAMPDFSATLLGLMGISAGTFIGFKIPEQNKA
jgi:hypothetical protein